MTDYAETDIHARGALPNRVPDFDLHRAELEAASSKADMVRYACAQLGAPTSAQVREWLVAYGKTVSKTTLYDTVKAYRHERGLTDTGDLPKLTTEALAELDAARDSERARTAADSGPDRRPDLIPESRTVPAEPVLVPESGLESLEAPEESGVRRELPPEPVPDRTPEVPEFRTISESVRTPVPEPSAPIRSVPEPSRDSGPEVAADRPLRSWPVLLLALPAFVAIWSGWVGLGEMTGFGVVHPLPGIADGFQLNTAITLPIGVEAYASYALYVWLSGRVRTNRTRRFAMWSALGSLALGAAGQVAYHLMEAAGMTAAPWWITTVVACLPVAVLGMGAALAHMIAHERHAVPEPSGTLRN